MPITTTPIETQRTRSHVGPLKRPLWIAFLGGGALSLTGCGGAPSITIAGAYFPAWLLCGIFAAVVATIARAAMVVTGAANYIPAQLTVCLSTGIIAAVILWRIWMVH